MTVKRRNSIEYLGKVRDAVQTETGLALDIVGGSAEITVVTPEILRFKIEFDNIKKEPELSYAVTIEPQKNPKFTLTGDDHEWKLDTGPLHVHINKYPFRIKIYDKTRRMLSRDCTWGGPGISNGKICCDKAITPGEHFYGFGEKAFTMDRAGKKMEMWTTEAAAHQWNSDPLYVSIPFFTGLHSGAAYGILFDSPWRANFSMGGRGKSYYTYSADGGPLNYYFIAGPSLKQVMGRYAELTGKPGVPPLWAMGFHQSRWSYKTESKVRKIAAQFRKLKIPCDVIHLDIHYMDGYRIFTWNKKNFQDPAKMISDLAEDGFKIVPIMDPGVKVEEKYSLYQECMEKDFFCRNKNGSIFRGVVWPGDTHFPDFARQDVRDWWAKKVKDFTTEYGHAGQWNDMNEPSVNIKPFMRFVTTKNMQHVEEGKNVPHDKLRNVYGFLEAEATHQGLLAARPDERPFILSRSGFAGIQRFAAIWSGDNTSSWRHMHLSIPLLCSLGMSGVPFVGADIGGFMGNCNAELFARWIQLGSFYPFSRAHTMMLTVPQQPWSFGDRVTDIAREYISLRYRLLPYIYSAFYESMEYGLPVMRPLVLEFQNDPPCTTIDDQFMFGESIMVAPVLRPRARSRSIYLPPGGWINFHTGARINGNQTIEVKTPLHVMPLFIRSGKIIPMWPLMMHTGEKAKNPLILNVYCGADATLELFEDDYHSYPAGAKCTATNFEYKDSLVDVELAGTPVQDKSTEKYKLERTHITALFHHFNKRPRWVVLNGVPITESWSADAFGEAAFKGWAWDQDKMMLAVGIKNSGAKFNLTIST